MLLQIYFEVKETNAEAFEDMYEKVYIPAMQVQEGYIGSRLLRVFPPAEGEDPGTQYNYQMNLVFDTEENRLKWVASDEHQDAFPKVQALAEGFAAEKYDVVGEDELPYSLEHL
jgi:antibiotic biosynthesis monooxygenase (ABM) superfamily enzyme